MRIARLLAVIAIPVYLLYFIAQSAQARAPEAPAVTVSITVTTYADEWNDTSPASASTKCSLREALQLAYSAGNRGCGNGNQAANIVNIQFFGSGTYVLTRDEELPNIGSGKTINIDSWGVEIDGGRDAAARYRGIFHVVGGTLNLKNLVLKNGSRPGGGAIWINSGTVIAYKVKFKNNDAAADNTLTQEGGAILVDTGALTVTESLFENNVALYRGGAVSTNFGYFYRTKFIGNRAAAGGALALRTPTTYPVVVLESEFKENQARPTAFNDPDVGYETRYDINGGGAIQNNGYLNLIKTLIENNKSELTKGGGGFSNEATGIAVLDECVIKDNHASARGNGDSNNHIDFAWGGGIFNAGELNLVRCSVHGNQADFAGAIFNHQPGLLKSYNSTISNNTATNQHGGVVNEHTSFDFNASYGGAIVQLYHTTIGKNHAGSGDGLGNMLWAMWDRSYRLGNSIIDTACNDVQYTVGRSVMTDKCVTMEEPGLPLVTAVDISDTSQIQLGLQPLSQGSSNVPGFMVQRIDGNSIAVDIGRDDAYGCSIGYVNRRDQNLDTRGAGGTSCDAGAVEAGQLPPQFSSNPGAGLVEFPIVDTTQAQFESFRNLTISNIGGGAMTFDVEEEPGDSSISYQSQTSGILFRNQNVTLTFRCGPTSVGDHWKNYVIHTNADNVPGAHYKFRCTASGPNPQASMSDEPGTYNVGSGGANGQLNLSRQVAAVDAPSTVPGQTANATITMTNQGHQPLTVNTSLANSSGMWGVSSAKLGPQTPGAITLNPGERMKVTLSCTPPSVGVFLNTLLLASNDPLNPAITYNTACEGAVNWPAETLQPDAFYAHSSPLEGIAISPEGTQVLAGRYNDDVVRIYSRNQSTGALNAYDAIGVTGMTQIYGIAYSNDGTNVYYTSQAGDGVVGLSRSGTNLAVSQVITTGTRYLCLINNNLTLCPIGSMNGARGVAVSPDDKNVYVAGHGDGTLTVFARNLATGNLSYQQTVTRTINGINVLGGAARIAISPDGENVYVAAITDNTVSVFHRNLTGRLSFVAAYKDGTGGLTRLGSPSDLTISPDGEFVYVTGYADDAVNIFKRSSGDGQLTFAQAITVSGAYGVATTHDNAGKRLFVTEYSADKVQVYGRSAVTGGLSLAGTYALVSPTSNINGPVFLAVSPDDMHIYASLYDGQGVRLFSTVHATPVLGQISPASAVAGSGSFTLTVHGGRFYPDSKISWNLSTATTQFISDHELQAVIPAGNIISTGAFFVSVLNATPGGGLATPVMTFTVTAVGAPPVPSIESVEPPASSFSGEPLLVTLHGANFAAAAQVSYNGAPVPTTFINSETLQALLSVDVLTEPGTGGITVSNGGAATSLALGPSAPTASSTSSVVGFTVSRAGTPAVPAASSLEPSSVVSGSAAIWLTINGHNFTIDSVGRWNGQARTTTLVDGTQLKMYVTADDLRTVGSALVTVYTPGAGESEPLAFKIRLASEKPVPVLTSFALDAGATRTLYANGSDFVNGAQIVINGAARATTFVNSNQLKLTLTPNDTGGLLSVRNPTPGGGTSGELPFNARLIYLPMIRR